MVEKEHQRGDNHYRIVSNGNGKRVLQLWHNKFKCWGPYATVDIDRHWESITRERIYRKK